MRTSASRSLLQDPFSSNDHLQLQPFSESLPMPVPTESGAVPHHTDRDTLTSPMDDLPVVIPAQAGEHSVAGVQVGESSTFVGPGSDDLCPIPTGWFVPSR